jgi:methanogenic corrinoid protein MtbC1
MNPQEQAGKEIMARRQELAECIVERQYKLQPGTWARYGEKGRRHSVQDAEYLLSFLADALAAGEPVLFTQYLSWAKVFFANLKLPADMLSETLRLTAAVLAEKLPAGAREAAGEVVAAGARQLAAMPDTLPSFIRDDAPLAELARHYLDALLAGERQKASRLILDTVTAGTPIRDLYLHVFQPCQYEIGRLWQTNRVTVAQEHFCTAASQQVMSQLYPYLFASAKTTGRRLVVTCVGGELHEIGIRMVADFFEAEGWDTYYIGANAPSSAVLQALADRQPAVLAISATMTFHVNLVSDLIGQVRDRTDSGRPKILVGGYPFNVSPDLWRRVGADGFAADAAGAVREAERLVA